MTDSHLLDPFDDEVIRAVASENGVDVETLIDALSDHQQTMRDNPGVEDLVYEWRKQFADPVLVRTESTYVVAVRATVWEEFGAYLGLDDYVLAAVSAVHQEQVLRTLDLEDLEISSDQVPLIVGRPGNDG